MIRAFSSVELALLCGFAFFLPLAEAPKNIFLFSLLFFWLVNSLLCRNFGTARVWAEFPPVCIVALSWVSALLTPLDTQGGIFLNTIDFLTIAGLFIVVSRSTFKSRQVGSILALVVAGIVAALFEGYLRGGRFPSLKSVGHINQTAIYLCLVTVAALAAVIASKRVLYRIATTSFFLLSLYLTVKTDSRNAVYATALTAFLVILILVLFARWKDVLLAGSAIALVAGGTLFLKPAFVEKQHVASSESHHIVDEPRLRLWAGALRVAAERPLVGYGVGTFGVAHSEQNIRKIIEKSGGTYSAKDYLFTDHAHNLSLNWLVERGVLALMLMYLWLLFIAWSGLTEIRRDRQIQFWPLLVALVVCASFFCGLGNTSWHHEHGLLAALFISLGMSKIRFSSLRN